ncbi:DUF1253-domain-containing protein [Mycena indigotica]|uniref:DUF1253-domain-containing protein n=1 Tax=Mycena indigotica TaxID=2126181 RepID=A0A8H6TFQ9_9AGAR|nr:DUF1253-domain-containing protein [Mycena indigotica]KAF7316429.1 DUF1253-domain-containing protein [Mycena indigotica]
MFSRIATRCFVGQRRLLSSTSQTTHAVISTFDLFSIGVGPSSSHTVGPMRAGNIFLTDLKELSLLDKVRSLKIGLYGSLAATGKGHHTPQAILLGLEGSDPETIDAGTIPSRYANILETETLVLAGTHKIHYSMDRDMLWRWDQVLKNPSGVSHANGMRFSAFGEDGELLATNCYFSVGGGFVVNDKTQVDENMFYKGVDKKLVHEARLHQVSEEDPSGPPYPFASGNDLQELSKKHNMTIAQIVWDNERSFGLSDDDIHEKLMRIWGVMDECIRAGVSTSETVLPGRLQLRRRAPMLYRRLMRGFYPGIAMPMSSPLIAAGSAPALDVIEAPDIRLPTHSEPTIGPNAATPLRPAKSRPARVVGSFDHALLPMPPRSTLLPAMDFLSCYAIAVNEVNAAGGRIVTAPTNGAAGIIPSVLKYIVEFVSDDHEKSIVTFLLTASAIGMLFKRASTIAAAEGGCQAEVGVACSMAAAGFAACMGASPATVLQAAEIGIEHNLGLTCDPIGSVPSLSMCLHSSEVVTDGLVQVPCIERNSLGAVKAITAAQLSLASDGVCRVTLDEAIEAMRLTAADMSIKYKETSLSGLAVGLLSQHDDSLNIFVQTSVKIPLTVPAC